MIAADVVTRDLAAVDATVAVVVEENREEGTD